MKITFDPKKNADNIRERQLSFDEVSKLEWSSAVILEDARKDYGERRFRVFGYIDERLYAAVFTPRESVVHVISCNYSAPRPVSMKFMRSEAESVGL